VLFTGSFSDNFSRRIILGVAAVLWSMTSFGMSFATTFTEVCAFRLLLGMFESFCPSAAYSLITDYFPPEIRTTANSYYAGCIFVGASLSSLSALLIGQLGWR
jgi:MFS family permease